MNEVDSAGWTALLEGAQCGHVGVVVLLLEHRAHTSHVEGNGDSALNVASFHGFPMVVAALLEKQAVVDQTNQAGYSSLVLGSQQGHVEVVSLLLAARANVHHRLDGGYSALHMACGYGHPNTVSMLLRAQAEVTLPLDDGYTGLHLAAGGGHAPVVELLISAAYGLGQPLVTHSDGENGKSGTDAGPGGVVGDEWPLLLQVLQSGDLHVELGVDGAAHDGSTALMCAAQNGHFDVVELLVGTHTTGGSHSVVIGPLADVNKAGREGWTALAHAAHKGFDVVTAFLLTKGADVDQATSNGASALMLAAQVLPLSFAS